MNHPSQSKHHNEEAANSATLLLNIQASSASQEGTRGGSCRGPSVYGFPSYHFAVGSQFTWSLIQTLRNQQESLTSESFKSDF